MFNINKINFKKEKSIVISLGDMSKTKITIKNYLPIKEKMNFLTDVLNDSIDEIDRDEGLDFVNPLKIQYSFEYNIVKYYTNLDLTEDKNTVDLLEIYDFLKKNKIIDKIIFSMPADEYNTLETMTYNLLEAFETYRTSVLGILDAMKDKKYAEELNIDEMIKNLNEANDDDELQILKDIMNSFGNSNSKSKAKSKK